MCVGDCSRSPEVCKEKGIAVVANRPLDGFYLGCRGTARFTSLGTMGSELNTDDVRDFRQKPFAKVCRLTSTAVQA